MFWLVENQTAFVQETQSLKPEGEKVFIQQKVGQRSSCQVGGFWSKQNLSPVLVAAAEQPVFFFCGAHAS